MKLFFKLSLLLSAICSARPTVGVQIDALIEVLKDEIGVDATAKILQCYKTCTVLAETGEATYFCPNPTSELATVNLQLALLNEDHCNYLIKEHTIPQKRTMDEWVAQGRANNMNGSPVHFKKVNDKFTANGRPIYHKDKPVKEEAYANTIDEPWHYPVEHPKYSSNTIFGVMSDELPQYLGKAAPVIAAVIKTFIEQFRIREDDPYTFFSPSADTLKSWKEKLYLGPAGYPIVAAEMANHLCESFIGLYDLAYSASNNEQLDTVGGKKLSVTESKAETYHVAGRSLVPHEGIYTKNGIFYPPGKNPEPLLSNPLSDKVETPIEEAVKYNPEPLEEAVKYNPEPLEEAAKHQPGSFPFKEAVKYHAEKNPFGNPSDYELPGSPFL